MDFLTVQDGVDLVVDDPGRGALAAAVQAYRSRIESDANLQLVDVGDVDARLATLEVCAVTENGWPLSVPLADGDGLLAIEIWSEAGFHERIQMASLFADLLDFQQPAGSAALAPIHEILRRWSARSITLWVSTLYESVLAVLSDCRSGGTARRAASSSLFARRGGNPYVIVRLAMEFAWVHALRDEATVHGQSRMVRRILGLGDEEARSYELLLGMPGPDGVRVCAESWRSSFVAQCETAADAYWLGGDARPELAPFERLLCMKYASEELGWEPGGDTPDRPYPSWLLDSTVADRR